MELRYHEVRDYARNLCWVPTDLNRADPLTKPLVGRQYISMFRCPDEEQGVWHEENARIHYVEGLV